MEFSFDDSMFDDDVEDKKKNGHSSEVYIPKFCEPLWFRDKTVDSVESCKDFEIRRFQADLLYFKGEYEAALQIYQDHLQTLKKEDYGVPKRMLFSSIIQCFLKLGHFTEAIPLATDMLECKLNPSDSNTFFLAYEVFSANGMLKEALVNLQQAIAINDSLPLYWNKLGELYRQITVRLSELSDQLGHENVNGWSDGKNNQFVFATYASLLRVRFLYTELTRDQASKVNNDDLSRVNKTIHDLEALGMFDENKMKDNIRQHQLDISQTSASSQGKQESLIIEGDINTRIRCFHLKWFPFSMDFNLDSLS